MNNLTGPQIRLNQTWQNFFWSKCFFSNVEQIDNKLKQKANSQTTIVWDLERIVDVTRGEQRQLGIIVNGASCFCFFLFCLSNHRGMVNVLILTQKVGSFFVLCIDIWKRQTPSFSELFGLILCFTGKLQPPPCRLKSGIVIGHVHHVRPLGTGKSSR